MILGFFDIDVGFGIGSGDEDEGIEGIALVMDLKGSFSKGGEGSEARRF